MYREFAQTAREEGLDEIATLYGQEVAEVEEEARKEGIVNC